MCRRWWCDEPAGRARPRLPGDDGRRPRLEARHGEIPAAPSSPCAPTGASGGRTPRACATRTRAWRTPGLAPRPRYPTKPAASPPPATRPPTLTPASRPEGRLRAGDLHPARDRYQIELLANLDQVFRVGAIAIVAFPKPEGGSGFRARSPSFRERRGPHAPRRRHRHGPARPGRSTPCSACPTSSASPAHRRRIGAVDEPGGDPGRRAQPHYHEGYETAITCCRAMG